MCDDRRDMKLNQCWIDSDVTDTPDMPMLGACRQNNRKTTHLCPADDAAADATAVTSTKLSVK